MIAKPKYKIIQKVFQNEKSINFKIIAIRYMNKDITKTREIKPESLYFVLVFLTSSKKKTETGKINTALRPHGLSLQQYYVLIREKDPETKQ